MPLLYVIADTPNHPDLSSLYRQLGYEVLRLSSQRQAISALKKRRPDRVVCEFVNAFHTYYQATNISNLDVFLQSLVKYAPATRVVVVVQRKDRELARQLLAIHAAIAFVTPPFGPRELTEALGHGGEGDG